jgi:tRNA pseudouridine-54 N-methylase
VLGDDQGYDKAAERALELSDASRPVRLGKGMLLTSHCQVIIHSLLDEM